MIQCPSVIYIKGTRETDRAFEMLWLEGIECNRPEAPNIAIIISDGPSTNSFLTRRAANALKQTGVEIFVVGTAKLTDCTDN